VIYSKFLQTMNCHRIMRWSKRKIKAKKNIAMS